MVHLRVALILLVIILTLLVAGCSSILAPPAPAPSYSPPPPSEVGRRSTNTPLPPDRSESVPKRYQILDLVTPDSVFVGRIFDDKYRTLGHSASLVWKVPQPSTVAINQQF